MSNRSNSQGVVHLPFAAAFGAYLRRIGELGAVEGPTGAVELSPTLQPIVAALHHVLAGGEVQVHIVQSGQPDIFQELQQRAEQAISETNALNHPPGTLVVTAV